MISELNISEIYEQNLNFLIGSGASYGYLPTLQLSIKDSSTEKDYTVETLSVKFPKESHLVLNTLLFMHYYSSCIKPAMPLPNSELPVAPSPSEIEVTDNYTNFMKAIIRAIKNKKSNDRKFNIYTTNYDGCLEDAAESVLKQRGQSITFNDGTSGFKKRIFHTKNYDNHIIQKGIFENHASAIPQINLLHIHGSVHWKKEGDGIAVDYQNQTGHILFDEAETDILNSFTTVLSNPFATEDDLLSFRSNTDINCEAFWEKYNLLPIVNPTKWKFHETVFEENYYQLLRHLSFELERPNTVFVTFGFSFADEHILHLLQRSLSNPSLTVYVCCFNSNEVTTMKERFDAYPNVKLVTTESLLDFTKFNTDVFSVPMDEEI